MTHDVIFWYVFVMCTLWSGRIYSKCVYVYMCVVCVSSAHQQPNGKTVKAQSWLSHLHHHEGVDDHGDEDDDLVPRWRRCVRTSFRYLRSDCALLYLFM